VSERETNASCMNELISHSLKIAHCCDLESRELMMDFSGGLLKCQKEISETTKPVFTLKVNYEALSMTSFMTLDFFLLSYL
jgi:hypothetical protein